MYEFAANAPGDARFRVDESRKMQAVCTPLTVEPEKVWSSTDLPTLPQVAVRLLELSSDPEIELAEIIRTIKTDVAISAKIIKAVNSSFFGLSSTVTSVDMAAALLGRTVVTSLTLSFSLVQDAMPRGLLGEHYSEYWKQSVVQASACEIISMRAENQPDCECFLAGLLLDIGRLAMLKTIPREYLQVLEAAKSNRLSIRAAESMMLGFDHLEVGRRLIERWNLPQELADAARLHDATVEQLRELSHLPHHGLLCAAAVAAAAGDYFVTPLQGEAIERLRELLQGMFSIGNDEVDQFLVDIRSAAAEMGEMLSIDASTIADPAQLMALANAQLAELTLREHAKNAEVSARSETLERENVELQTRNRCLQAQVMRDPLTNTFNRSAFEEMFQKEIPRCQRQAKALGVLFVDVDNFKSLNDIFGHQFGDRILKSVALCMDECLRKGDFLCRYGGEEFVILAVDLTTPNDLAQVAERVRTHVERMEVLYKGEKVSVTISVGGCYALPSVDDVTSPHEMVRTADEAMYCCKRDGRNRSLVQRFGDDSVIKNPAPIAN